MDEVTPQQPASQPHEMEQYGFDPSNPADVEKWNETTGGMPAPEESVKDYSRDRFEFGGVADDEQAPDPSSHDEAA